MASWERLISLSLCKNKVILLCVGWHQCKYALRQEIRCGNSSRNPSEFIKSHHLLSQFLPSLFSIKTLCSAKGPENYPQADSPKITYSCRAVSPSTALSHLSNPVTYQHSSYRLAGCIFGILGVWLRGHRGTGFDLQSYCFLRGCNEQFSSESRRHRKWYTERET